MESSTFSEGYKSNRGANRYHQVIENRCEGKRSRDSPWGWVDELVGFGVDALMPPDWLAPAEDRAELVFGQLWRETVLERVLTALPRERVFEFEGELVIYLTLHHCRFDSGLDWPRINGVGTSRYRGPGIWVCNTYSGPCSGWASTRRWWWREPFQSPGFVHRFVPGLPTFVMLIIYHGGNHKVKNNINHHGIFGEGFERRLFV